MLERLGFVMSGLAVLVMIADGCMMLFMPGLFVDMFRQEGMPLAMAPFLGALAVATGLVYAVPRTAVLGAILITGFLGGAISIHFRIGEYGPGEALSLTIGALAWGGLYLRDARVRALLPFTTPVLTGQSPIGMPR